MEMVIPGATRKALAGVGAGRVGEGTRPGLGLRSR
jgi:hypothetical protein